MGRITIQIHTSEGWTDAAVIDFDEPGRGIAGKCRLAYDDMYFFDHASVDAVDGPVTDRRALSVQLPVNLETSFFHTWPPFLLDMMPQGAARRRLAEDIGKQANDPAVELPLLLRAGGGPIGNLRIKEAWEAEQNRLAAIECPPLSDEDIRTRSERFLDVVDRFAMLASGSSGVQGEWPKALMTRRADDGFWYPDPFVDTQDGAEHIIVKLLRSTNHGDALIISSEEPYLKVAEAFGLNVATPLHYGDGALIIPRFDRSVIDGAVTLHGQESLVSALGIAQFGYVGNHEDYLAVIRKVSDDPAADVLEYVLRDVLNATMGNPDNHGRNMALTKRADGAVRLAPVYDFAPMRLSAAGVVRSTRWRCLRGHDLEGQWDAVCEAVSWDELPAAHIKKALLERVAFLHDLPRIASDLGINEEVIARACGAHADVARAIEKLEA